MSIASAGQEASTAAVTRSCFEKFQQCLQQTDGKTKIHIQTRLADLRLWTDSVGAVAHEKASLDYRFRRRPDAVRFIRDLLSMLEGFLKDMEECFLAAKHEADLQGIMTNIDSTIDTLAFIGVQIRRSGRKSRIRKVDSSFDQNQDRYRNLRAHLACVVLAKSTEEGRPINEGKDIHSVDYIAKIKLSPIQERLIRANLRRRHRFEEAQRHSGRLKGHSGNVAPPVIPQQFITISTTQHAKQDISQLQDKRIAAVMRQQSSRPGPKKEDTHTIAPTSASGLDSKWGGLQEKRRPEPTATCLTSTMAKMRYPRAHKLPDAEQKLAKCPCCCQAISATELEGSRWRKHVANDLCPYTCVVANCPTPYNLFVTQEEWNDHVINDHPPHWQCPCCVDDPLIFESISGITYHLMTQHADEVGADLEEFLLDAEMNIIGITNCPLCDFKRLPDSLDLVEHVLQHVHDFSLRSLPWPADLPITLDKSAGLFDMSHAVKIVKDKEGNVFKHDIAKWAEHVVPTFDQSRGVLICYDKEGKELILSAASTLEAAERRTSLQLRDVDRNTLKKEEESTQQDSSRQDYFSQFGIDYFVDESSDGRFSQTYHLTQRSGATERLTKNHEQKRWICPMCHAQSKPESSGEKDFFEHLIPSHPVEQAEIDSSGGKDRWMRYMLAEAYWCGTEADSTSAVEGSEKELLLDKGADVNAQGGEYGNALQAASSRGDEAVVKVLLDKGADINAQGETYNNALYAASERGHEQVVKLLLDRGADVNAQGRGYGNALQATSVGGHEQVVKLLLDAGADVNAQGGTYNNALYAASEGGHEAVVKLLLNAGADINAQGETYNNALYTALLGGHKAAVKVLLDAVADVNAQGETYNNAPYAASERGKEAVVKLLLLDAGAKVNSQGRHYGNALYAASYRGHEAVVKVLLDAGADVNAQGGTYNNALQAASYRGHEAVVKVLLDAGADVNAQGGTYNNALYAASEGGHEAVVKLLLDAGADVNAQAETYNNAFYTALLEGHKAAVKVLLDAGADVNAQGETYNNALYAALEEGKEVVVKLLTARGAK